MLCLIKQHMPLLKCRKGGYVWDKIGFWRASKSENCKILATVAGILDGWLACAIFSRF